MHKKGLISFAADPGGFGEYGGCHTFFHNGLQEQILASQDGATVIGIYRFYHGNLGFYEFTCMPFRLCNTLQPSSVLCKTPWGS